MSTKTEYILITNANDDPLADITPAGQVGFTANTTVSKVSNTDCTVTEVFKGAATLTLSGGGIATGNLRKYIACTNVADMEAVDANYKSDLTASRAWVYPLPELVNGESAFSGASLTAFHAKLPKCQNVTQLLYNCPLEGKLKFSFPVATVATQFAGNSTGRKYTEIEVDAPLLTSVQNVFTNYSGNDQLKKIVLKAERATNYNNVAQKSYALIEFYSYDAKVTSSRYGFDSCSKLEIFDCNLSNLSDGTGMFQGCILSKTSALNVLNGIPKHSSGTHAITVGIHVDYKNDADIATAVSNAESKGWTVTVQWNGTAGTSTASTFGMRRQTIYARTAEMETPDGMETVLDWGHYVTNWEENGYLEFASVEAACEYWGLEPYVDPEWEEELIASE